MFIGNAKSWGTVNCLIVALVALPVVAKADDPMTIVPKIGSIMREFGKQTNNLEWEKAAKLQDLWLSFPRHVASPVAPDVFDYSVLAWPAQTGITVDWILKSEVDSDRRAKTAFDALKNNIVTDPDGKMRSVIEKQVNRMFASTAANTVQLGSLKLAPGVDLRAFHAQQVQKSTVEEAVTTPLDPLLGALGAFNFYAIPVGQAQKLADGTVRVAIDNFLIYVIDSFDFEGLQLLGYWKLPDKIAKQPFEGSMPITNGVYRDYRNSPAANGKGGDFLVVSDTRTEPLLKSFAFAPEATVNGTWASSTASSTQKPRFVLAINGNSVEWTETGPETGIVYKKTLNLTKQGDMYRIERPNNDVEVLKMLGFQNPALQQAILNNNPHPSFLLFQLQNGRLVARWSGIRVKKTPQGGFQSLVQPEDPAYPPTGYTFTIAN